eukprot:15356964-Ditylum_brightwellii.AAC.1
MDQQVFQLKQADHPLLTRFYKTSTLHQADDALPTNYHSAVPHTIGTSYYAVSTLRLFDPGGLGAYFSSTCHKWSQNLHDILVLFMTIQMTVIQQNKQHHEEEELKGKANHSTKKEDAGTMKERILPCTVVLHSSNEKLPKLQDAPGSSYKENKQYHYDFQQNKWQLIWYHFWVGLVNTFKLLVVTCIINLEIQSE